MKTAKNTLVYFSATYTTKRIISAIADQLGGNVNENDITQSVPENDIKFGKDDLFIIGVPVYEGRVPAEASEALHKYKGDGTPAIIVCVYGNRDYDDALLELKDIVTGNGFKVISAGAFIAQHSIFPGMGLNRPDERDMEQIREFGNLNARLLESVENVSVLSEVTVKGNYPYKTPRKVPLQPEGNIKCNECGTCVSLCPSQAIYADEPRKTDNEKCISCGRCIVVCPQNARHFEGELYKMAESKFTKAFSARQEPITIYGTRQ